MVSSFSVDDAHAKRQLGAGVYPQEGNLSWRWTAGKFEVSLATPAGAAQKGATLTFKLAVPDGIIQQVHSTTLSASAGDAKLAPETYSKAGPYEYKRDIPATACQGEIVRIEFAVDHPLPPGPVDKREFGVVAQAFRLVSK